MTTASKVSSLDAPEKTAVDVAQEAPVKKITGKSSGSGEMSGKTTRIKVFAGEGDQGAHPAFVSHNGTAYLIPRGEVVEVPDELLEILDNAITAITSPNRNGIGVMTRDVLRYNYQVVR